MKELLHIPAMFARNIKAVTTHPSSVRHASITAVLWGIAAGCSFYNIGTDIISGDYTGLTAFPWVLLTLGVAVMDIVMLRWSLLGLAYARARAAAEEEAAADRAEFDRITRGF